MSENLLPSVPRKLRATAKQTNGFIVVTTFSSHHVAKLLALIPVVAVCGMLMPMNSWGQGFRFFSQFGTAGSDEAQDIASYGNAVYVVGRIASTGASEQGRDIYQLGFVRRIDSKGEVVWERRFGDSAIDSAEGVFANADGVYVSGTTVEPPADTSNPRVLIAKYDHEGELQWRRQFGFGGPNSAPGVGADGSGVYVGGAFADGRIGFVYKFDADGNAVWSQTIGADNGDSIDGVTDIGVDESGIYAVGIASDPALPESTVSWDAFVTKYDSTGSVVWSRKASTPFDDRAFGITMGPTGLYVVGSTQGRFPGQVSRGATDAYIRHYDRDGTALWTRQFGSSDFDRAYAVAVDRYGVYVVGTTTGIVRGNASAGIGGAFARRFALNGDDIWTTQFPGRVGFQDAYGVLADDNGLIVVGRTSDALPSQTSFGSYDVFMAKLSKFHSLSIDRQYGLHSLGDINADGTPEVAVVANDWPPGATEAIVTDVVSGATVSRFTFDSANELTLDVGVADDVNANRAPELARLTYHPAKVEIVDTLTGKRLREVSFTAPLIPIDLEILNDLNGNGAPELAVLGRGSLRAEVRDALSAAALANVYFNPNFDSIQLLSFPDPGGSNQDALGVLSLNNPREDSDKIETRDIVSRRLVNQIWFGNLFTVRQAHRLRDLNGNGSSEVAVLRDLPENRYVNVLLNDSLTNEVLRRIALNPDYAPIKLVVLDHGNSLGFPPIGVLGIHRDNGNVRLALYDSQTGEYLRSLYFNAAFMPRGLVQIPDVNDDGHADLVYLGEHPNGYLRIMVHDVLTGERINFVNVFPRP